MSMTDPIADLLTRIRNANMRRHATLDMPASRAKENLLNVMVREGYLRSVERVTPGEGEKGHPTLKVGLKYVDGKPAIEGLKRVSKPGLRNYVAKDEIPWVQGGYGISILSTSQGLMTDKQARRAGIGGEVLCSVW
ncbi:MAG: 30S ribosomal protein S8 [Leptospirillia bacterium]